MPRPIAVGLRDRESGATRGYTFTQSPIVFGRDVTSCDLVIVRSEVSKLHGEIAFSDEAAFYLDLDSRNGSLLDGRAIPSEVKVPLPWKSVLLVGGRVELTVSQELPDRDFTDDGADPFQTEECGSVVPKAPMIDHPTAPRRVAAKSVAVERPLMDRVVPLSFPIVPTMDLPSPLGMASAEVEPPRAGKRRAVGPGTVLAHYRLERVIGRGGMGTVFEAGHTRIEGKRFAVKVLSDEVAAHPEAEKRFLIEAEAASRLDHPHIVSVIDFGNDDGVPYLVMEYLRGEDLASLIARRDLSIERIADTVMPITRAVEAAHRKKVIHRDLKPHNVFLASIEDSRDVVPKILDFGIAKLRSPEGATLWERPDGRSIVGTPNYLAPELAEGAPASTKSDQYAVGAILYECATRCRPHDGPTLYTVLRSVVQGTFTRPSSLRPDIPPDFEAIILKAMALNPQQRFSSVHELGRALHVFTSSKRQAFWSDFYREDSSVERSHFGAFAVSGTRRPERVSTPEVGGTRKLPEALPGRASSGKTPSPGGAESAKDAFVRAASRPQTWVWGSIVLAAVIVVVALGFVISRIKEGNLRADRPALPASSPSAPPHAEAAPVRAPPAPVSAVPGSSASAPPAAAPPGTNVATSNPADRWPRAKRTAPDSRAPRRNKSGAPILRD
jgi:serine/threonine-protein kinase